MKSPHGVSIVICCFNRAERLPETLGHVALQAVPAHIPWEVVVVDNASTDRTADVARRQWSTLGCQAPFRVVEQPVPGLSAARDTGLEEAAYEFILYCDDDNWLGADYVRHVYELMVGNPRIGAVGGHGRAVGENPLPAWFPRYGRYYAVGHQGDESGDITDAKGYLYGTGFAVRRSVLVNVKRLGFTSRLSDRKGRTLSSGGDLQISYLIRLAGYRLWFDTRLEFAHFMPAGRLRWTYFLSMVEGTHRSRPYVDAFQRTLRDEADGRAAHRSWPGQIMSGWHLLVFHVDEFEADGFDLSAVDALELSAGTVDGAALEPGEVVWDGIVVRGRFDLEQPNPEYWRRFEALLEATTYGRSDRVSLSAPFEPNALVVLERVGE